MTFGGQYDRIRRVEISVNNCTLAIDRY